MILALMIAAVAVCLIGARQRSRSLRAAGLGGGIVLALAGTLIARRRGERPRVWKAP